MYDSKEFMVINVMVSFSRGEGLQEVGHGCRLPFEFFYMRTPLEAVREVLVMTKKGLVWSGKVSTSCFRKAFFILEKAILWSTDHCHRALL